MTTAAAGGTSSELAAPAGSRQRVARSVQLGARRNLKAASGPVCAVAPLSHRCPHELADHALHRAARLGVIDRRRGERTAVAPDYQVIALLTNLCEPAELIEQLARRSDALPQPTTRPRTLGK